MTLEDSAMIETEKWIPNPDKPGYLKYSGQVELKTALAGRDHWKKASTLVVRHDGSEIFPNTHRIYLHNNHIADAWADCTGKIYATPNLDTLREWPTVTTLSRLRALGIDVYRANNWIHLGRDMVCEAWR